MTDETPNGNALATTDQQPRRVARPKLEADGGGVMAIIPRDLPETMRYATGLAASGIVPDAYRFDGKKDNEVNVNLVAMGCLKAMEIGLPPQTGLAFLLPINGRFGIWGDGMWALVQKANVLAKHTVEWVGPDFDKVTTPLDRWPSDYGCIVSIWRIGQDEPYVGKFTVADAKRANLWANNFKKPWVLYPDRMLFNRARAFPLRDGFADCLFGLANAEEVMDTLPDKVTKRRVDNSALDDDLPALLPPKVEADADEAAQRLEAYISGLSLIATLETLAEYQQTPDAIHLMQALQRNNQTAYDRMIAANARRYQEIEAAEREADLAASEAKAQAESEGDIDG